MASSSSLSSRNWSYDVFTSFSGEDVRKNFYNHFLEELERKWIIPFKHNEKERSELIATELVQAIRDSRVVVVVLSNTFASSSWCLNELLEIMQCERDLGQRVIPIFYGLDPSHLKKQSGYFGEAFRKTCHNQTEEVKTQWKQALTDVANMLGYHWDNDNVKMIEEIAIDVLGKLNLSQSQDWKDFVGIIDHIQEMNSLLNLDSEKVKRVGIWGPFGIGKTTIARSLFSLISSHFQSSNFIDRGFVSKSMEIYSRSNPDDYKVKSRLQKSFLSEILGKKHQKVLIVIDGLDDQLVLDALAVQTQWFGNGSIIIVVTHDKSLLRAHGIDHIYEVCLPCEELALKMFCQSTFGQDYPPECFRELAFKVVSCADHLPFGLQFFGWYLRGRGKEEWKDMITKLHKCLDEIIKRTLRFHYDVLLNEKHKLIFRYIACLPNFKRVRDIEGLLADSDLEANIGLKILVDKSLLCVREDTIEMQYLLQEMGKDIVRAQSNDPGEQEFLVDTKDICHVLEDNIANKKVLGISLDMDDIDELHIHESAFKGMCNLQFLNFYTKNQTKEVRWHMPKEFEYFSQQLRLLYWQNYPLRCMPTKFCPVNLVELQMLGSKLEKLWEGVQPLERLKIMDLGGSKNLQEIPDLSKAINLEKLCLNNCSSLVELPSSIQHLNKLEELSMQFCENLEIIPSCVNLKSLDHLDLSGCSRLRSFPDISANISFLNLSEIAIEDIPHKFHIKKIAYHFMDKITTTNVWEGIQPWTSLTTVLSFSLKKLWLSDSPCLVEIPSSLQNLYGLEELRIRNCTNLEILPTKINLKFLDLLDLSGCSQLRSFPDISTNIATLILCGTAIEEVPCCIENFSGINYIRMTGCNNLRCVSMNIYKLIHLETVDFLNCELLTEARLDDSPNALEMATDNINHVPKVTISLINCFNLDQELLYHKQAVSFKSIELPGEEVPSYFTRRTTGTSLTIPLLRTTPSQPLLRFRACAVVNSIPITEGYHLSELEVCCLFKNRLGNQSCFSYFSVTRLDCHMVVFDCCFPLNEDNACLAEVNHYQVEIQFRLISDYPHFKLKACGIRLLEEYGDSAVEISASPNWVYDLFPSFRGEDVRKNFLSHFLKELDRKTINAFKDNEIERSQSIWPELVQAIRGSRIMVAVFSETYASSSWCLNELLEIVTTCKEEFGQIVIPVFYHVDPSDVRNQTGDFGKAFETTCKQTKSEELKVEWQKALNDVANMAGYHFQNWESEATMIENITSDVFCKLLSTTSKEFEDLVGIEDHIAGINTLLRLESEEVKMLGIWGSSGIGKTTIARALLSRFSPRFQRSVFIDMAFVSKSKNLFPSANADDYNLKSHLRKEFLSEIFGEKDTKKEHLGVLEERLKHGKALIIIDDLDDPMVLDALVGQNHRFGRGSRIIMVTKDKHLLRARKVDYIYEVVLPSKELSLKMLCRYAFSKDSPPYGLMELASEVALLAGNLPMGLNVLGSHLQGRSKEDCIDMLSRLRSGLDGRIGKTMRVSYDGLNNKKDEAIFRHIACFFNGANINDIKEFLADSDLDINIGLVNLVDKSLIQVRSGNVEMHCLLQEMGKEIVRAESNDPGEREFLVDSKDICYVLSSTSGTKKILGILLDTDEIDELNVHVKAFESLHNLVFLNIYTKNVMIEEEERLHLPEGFNYFSPKLRFLRWDRYPISYMPSNFRPENLVKLQMQGSKLENLWKGVCELKGLKFMDLGGSRNLMEIPNLSKATNLQILRLNYCSSLVELPSTIQYLCNLVELNMQFCENLEILPTGINLQSLCHFNLFGCSRLKRFPEISTNISLLDISQTAIEAIPTNLHLKKLVNLFMDEMTSVRLWEVMQPITPLMTMLPPTLERLYVSDIPSLVELPSSIQNLYKLEVLHIIDCTNLETLPAEINLEFLNILDLSGCSRLRSFPNISTNVSELFLERTDIEEVPWWIENFARLIYLHMSGCDKLKYVSLNIYKLEHLEMVDFSYCGSLTAASWIESPRPLAMETKNIHSKFRVSKEASTLLPDNYVPKIQLKLSKCYELDEEATLQQQPWFFKSMMFLGNEVPPFFTHRTTGTTLSVPLLQTSLSQQFFKFKACAVVASKVSTYIPFEIQVNCWFIDSLWNRFYSDYWPLLITTAKFGTHLVMFECCFHRFPLNEDNAPLTQLSYDYVELEFFTDYHEFQIIGCGIRLPEDGPYLKSDGYRARSVRRRRAPRGRCSSLGYFASELFMNRRSRKQMSILPRTPVRTMLSTFLTSLELSNIPILVETLSSFQIPNNLKKLRIIYCMNLETLPKGMNLKSLDLYYLTRCSRLQTFPDVSTNISKLYLSHTGIEEVPCWIKYLSHLVSLEMWKCNQLKCISPRIFQLNNIDVVSFSDCDQLTVVEGTKEAKGINNPLTMLIMLTNCFRLNQDAFAQQSASMHLILPGVKVPPYVTNRSTGSFLTVPLHHPPLSQQSPLDFKSCILLSEVTASHHQLCFIDIHVHYRFRDSHGNYFEPAEPSYFSLDQKNNHMIMFDCHFPLNQEWDQVEIEFRHHGNRLRLKECCMPLSDDSTPFPVTWNEADESKFDDDDDEGYATALSKEEWGGDSDDIGYETADDEEECGDNTDNEEYDTALSEEEYGDNRRSY